MRPTQTALLWLAVVHAVPSIPPPISANAEALRERLAAAIAAGDRTFEVKPGKYTFSNSSLQLAYARNLVVNAAGAEFVFYFGFGLDIESAQNLTVRGLTLDTEPPCYAQGVVTNVSDGSDSFSASFDERFIPPDTGVEPFSAPGGSAGAKVAFWDAPSRRMISPVNFLQGSTTHVGGDRWHIPLKFAQAAGQGLEVGSLVTIFPRRGYTWRCANCSAVTAEGVTIHGGGNMGFLEEHGPGGNLYSHVAIKRRPNSPGLMALNADGFHSDGVGIGPTLTDSEISFTGDDFVNVHNRMQVICKKLSNGSLAIVDPSHSLSALHAGDEISFYQLLPGTPHAANQLIGTGSVARSALVTAADEPLLQQCHGVGEAMQQPPYSADLIGVVASSLKHAAVFRVDFARPLPDAVAASLYNLANFELRGGANFVLSRNHFHDSCGSGGRIIAKAVNGTLIDNIAERFGGIHVYTEQIWLEGALGIRNVHLVNNTIVDAHIAEPTSIDVMPGLKNITCLNTTFVVRGAVTRRSAGCAAG